jgi:hypothetical protein
MAENFVDYPTQVRAPSLPSAIASYQGRQQLDIGTAWDRDIKLYAGFLQSYALLVLKTASLSGVQGPYKKTYHWACSAWLAEPDLLPRKVDCINLYDLVDPWKVR